MTHGIVSAAQPEAVEAGVLALKKGGNAVDAAIACAIVQGVVDPLMTSIGGMGVAQVYMPGKGVHDCLNFLGQAPAATRPDMWVDKIVSENADGFGFRLDDRANEIGYQSVCVPGNVRGYWELASAHGSMDWSDLCAAGIKHAEEGWRIRPHVITYIRQNEGPRIGNEERIRHTPAARAQFCDEEGATRTLGGIVPNPDLAETLRLIARDGADAFYGGAIAERIDSDMTAHGGLLRKADLAGFGVRRAAPLKLTYRGLTVASQPPPASGLMILEMLGMLEHLDPGALPHLSADYIALLTEVIKRAGLDRMRHMGDPEHVTVPVDDLLDSRYLQSLAESVKAGERASYKRFDPTREGTDTTQVSTMDEHGNAVSITHTLGIPSGVVTDGLGFMYNAGMAIFDPRPGRPASLAPGRRYQSSMSPTMVFKGEEVRMAIGAPGATHIPLALMQVLVNVIDFGMSMAEAIAAPRISVTADPIDVVNRIPRFVTDDLEGRGYEVRRSYLSYGFAGVHGVMRDDQGRFSGGADPGRDGMALAV